MKEDSLVYLVIGAAIAYFLFSERKGIMTATKGLLDKVADAIQQFEGWSTGSRSYRNNNPGNIKASSATWQGQVAVDSHGFAVFDTYENGRRALLIMLNNAATGASSVYSPSMSLYDFFSKYAPSSDNNEPNRYAEFVANQVGVSPSDPINQLV